MIKINETERTEMMCLLCENLRAAATANVSHRDKKVKSTFTRFQKFARHHRTTSLLAPCMANTYLIYTKNSKMVHALWLSRTIDINSLCVCIFFRSDFFPVHDCAQLFFVVYMCVTIFLFAWHYLCHSIEQSPIFELISSNAKKSAKKNSRILTLQFSAVQNTSNCYRVESNESKTRISYITRI